MTPNKPYLIRAIYDWIVDNGLTPYLLVKVDSPSVQVPQEHVSANKIILNISPKACRGMHLDNEKIIFTARFSGSPFQVAITPALVLAIYAKENGRGMEFPEDPSEPPLQPILAQGAKGTAATKPALTLVKNK